MNICIEDNPRILLYHGLNRTFIQQFEKLNLEWTFVVVVLMNMKRGLIKAGAGQNQLSTKTKEPVVCCVSTCSFRVFQHIQWLAVKLLLDLFYVYYLGCDAQSGVCIQKNQFNLLILFVRSEMWLGPKVVNPADMESLEPVVGQERWDPGMCCLFIKPYLLLFQVKRVAAANKMTPVYEDVLRLSVETFWRQTNNDLRGLAKTPACVRIGCTLSCITDKDAWEFCQRTVWNAVNGILREKDECSNESRSLARPEERLRK